MYRAELYFIGTREFVSLPFGGPIDNIEDPETGLAVGLRVLVSTHSSVTDPATLITKFVGTRQGTNDMITDWSREQVLKALRTGLVKQLTKQKWPVLGLAARTDEIETTLLADVQAPLTPYGIKITRLGNITISLSPEDEQTLKGLRKDQAYSRLAGGFRSTASVPHSKASVRARRGRRRRHRGPRRGHGARGDRRRHRRHESGPAAGWCNGGGAPVQGGGGPGTGGGGVTCGYCHANNPAGAKFCGNCGTPLAPPKAAHCTQCGNTLAPGAKFCGNCGTAQA